MRSCRVWFDRNPTPLLVYHDCYDALRDAWMHGVDTFYTTRTANGNELILKLKAIVAITAEPDDGQ